jgi:hypothetical protein
MTHPIGTCIWFNNNAKEAADLYATIFTDFKLISENPLAVVFEIHGRRFMNLNGGPGYTINPSISFYATAETEQEADELWNKLSDGGKVMMPLNKYPWAEKYGWCADKFGVNWQIMVGHQSKTKVMPHLMFTQHNSGKAGEAINFYTSLFNDSSLIAVSKYEKGEPDVEGYIKYSQFELGGLPFGAMDSSGPHQFVFSEGVSFIITVDTQEEIDHYWNALVENGQPGRCGWLKDRYGMSWQIVPSVLGKLMTDKEKAPKATYAFLQMSKFIIADLLKAVE